MVGNAPLTVLIVDDEPDIRTIVRAVLDAAPGEFEIVGEATNGAEAVEAIVSLHTKSQPDVVILDQRMPDQSGIETARQILDAAPDQPIILFGTTIAPDLEERAVAAGISACVGKLDVDALPRVMLELTAEAARRSRSRRRPLTAAPAGD